MRSKLDVDIDAVPSKIQQALFEAIERSPSGDRQLLKRLIDEGADPYFSGSFGALVLTPLQRAISLGHNDWIGAYADLGLDLNAKSRLGGDAGTTSVIYKNVSALEALNERGASLHESRCNGGGLLHLAVYHQCEPIVRKLHALGFDIDGRSEDGRRPIHEAASSVEMIRLLVDLGANLHSVNDRMQTVAHLAADLTDGSPEVLMWLLANGANLLMVDESGKSPADFALQNPDIAGAVQAHLAAREARIALECIELARTGNAPPAHAWPRFAGEGALERLKNVAAFGTTEELDVVIAEFGIEPLLLAPNPVAMAARKGNDQMIHHLLEVGFAVDALGDRGVTPLADSIAFEEYGATAALLDAGADVNMKSESGKSALEVAKEGRDATGETMILAALARRAAASAADELLGLQPPRLRM